MTSTCRWIQDLVLRMQGAFLDTPRLALTLSEARKRFGVDETTCGAVLAALADSQVLTTTPEGAYIRYFPHSRRRITRHAA